MSNATPIPLGRLGSGLWALKTRLQFTGWLQFLPSGVFASLFLIVAAIAKWLGASQAVVGVPLVIGGGFAFFFAFDLATGKFGLRPREAMPTALPAMDAFDLMRTRRSCRSFQPRPLTDAHRDRLVELARAGTAPEQLLGEHRIRFEYIAAPLTVWPVIGAKEFFVAIAPKEYSRTAVIDVGRSLQKVVLEATRMGVATCWIGPGADHTSILATLGERFDPHRDHIICVCALGYRSRFIPVVLRLILSIQRRRLPLGELFFAEPTFRTPLDPEAEPFSEFGRCYEVCQWSPSSFNAQPTRAAAVTSTTDEGERLARFDFAASTTSRFYAPVALGIWLANWETGCEALGIPGALRILDEEEREVRDADELPRYDASWVAA
ncbi:MAG: nitroreductase family protein [Deltaproteobacteria bacterium]|nr:nitroreductase family protein [Deltaproteobacteria bacterium]